MTRAGLPETYGLPEKVSDEGSFYLDPIYSTSPGKGKLQPDPVHAPTPLLNALHVPLEPLY